MLDTQSSQAPRSCSPVSAAAQEYETSHDVEEADRCLRGLNVPFFHHELVKQLLLACMSNTSQQDPLLHLLQHLAASGELSSSQIIKVTSHQCCHQVLIEAHAATPLDWRCRSRPPLQALCFADAIRVGSVQNGCAAQPEQWTDCHGHPQLANHSN